MLRWQRRERVVAKLLFRTMHNDKTHARSPNFQVGNYVLVAEHRKSGTSK
jgi:hypothetical protein